MRLRPSLALLAFLTLPASAQELPKGWERDARFADTGVEIYRPLTANGWLECHSSKASLSAATFLEGLKSQSPVPIPGSVRGLDSISEKPGIGEAASLRQSASLFGMPVEITHMAVSRDGEATVYCRRVSDPANPMSLGLGADSYRILQLSRPSGIFKNASSVEAMVKTLHAEELARRRRLVPVSRSRETGQTPATSAETGPAKPITRVVYTRYNRGMGANRNLIHDVWVLYGDGTAVRDPDSLAELQGRETPSKSRKAEWRGKGNRIEIRKSGRDWTRLDDIVGDAEPLKAGTRLDQNYRRFYVNSRIGGDLTGVSGGGISVDTKLRFNRDGTFTRSVSSMGQAVSPGGGSTATMAGRAGPDGCSSAIAVSGPVAGGGSGRSDCGDGKSGTYTLEGYTLTLNRNDGRIETLPVFKSGPNISIAGKGFIEVGK